MAASIARIRQKGVFHLISLCKWSFNVPKRCMSTTELKKFYKNAYIAQADGWFEINLDRRKLRTPAGNLFRVPNESLAMAVATEWNSQDKIIRRHTMLLTSLCNMAIDNPTQKSREDLIRSILHFLHTDTVCYRLSEPEDLLELQSRKWEPVVDWVRDRYKVELQSTTSLFGPEVPPATLKTLERHLQSFGDWSLYGLQYGAEVLKSVVLLLAVVDKYLTIEEAIKLTRLENDYQIERWGNVEWYHDLDVYNLQARLSAAALFIHWCGENYSIKKMASFSQINLT